MYVKSLDLLNFRNYDSASIQLDPGINIFYGDNAQGKTNILEAIYLGGTSKSHKGTKDRDMIKVGREESHIRMHVDKNQNDYRIDMHLKKNRSKGIAIGGIPIRRAGELFGIVNIVFFSPEDLNIIKNGPGERRRFLDLILCETDKIYMSDLAQYGKCPVWDEQLANIGTRIIDKRTEFILALSEIASEIHLKLTGGKEELSLSYEPNTESALFLDKITKNREIDKKMKTTTSGPHRDDFCIRANEMDLRTYGSQGQQRTAALTLKLSEIRLIEERIHDHPVLLLDDVLSELDRDRQNYLLQSIKGTQTLITCTGLDEFVENNFVADRTFHVKEGSIE